MLTGGIAAVVAALCALTRRLLWDHPASAGGVIQFKPLWNRGAAFGLPVGRPGGSRPLGAVPDLGVAVRGRNPVGAGLLLGGAPATSGNGFAMGGSLIMSTSLKRRVRAALCLQPGGLCDSGRRTGAASKETLRRILGAASQERGQEISLSGYFAAIKEGTAQGGPFLFLPAEKIAGLGSCSQ